MIEIFNEAFSKTNAMDDAPDALWLLRARVAGAKAAIWRWARNQDLVHLTPQQKGDLPENPSIAPHRLVMDFAATSTLCSASPPRL